MQRFIHLFCLIVLSMPVALAAASPGAPAALRDSLDAVPVWVTGPAGPAVARATTSKTEPRQFAVSLPLPLTLADGAWQAVDDQAVWRAVVESPGAVQLSLQFADVTLPAAALLWIYAPDRRVVQGPYSRTDVAKGGALWTALVPGDTAVVEVDVPQAQANAVQLRLAIVHHAFARFGTALPSDAVTAKAGGSAGACEIDLACPAGNAWRDDARAVAMISVGGDFQCTATLLNDVPGSGEPYMLTAKHCGIGTLGNPASSVTVYWNYQADRCMGDGGSLQQSQAGATLLVSGAQSDFTLIRLNRVPPTAFDVRYAGWDARGEPPQSGASVHHPENDVAKISLFATPAQAQTIALATGGPTTATTDVWGVLWAQGVTEDGSSGAPLFDQDHRVVGQLSGGASNCANPGGEDYFGRFAVSWSTSPQLARYLDPQAVGALVVDARDANAAPLPPAVPDAGNPAGATGKTGGGAGDPLVLLGLAALGLRRRFRGSSSDLPGR